MTIVTPAPVPPGTIGLVHSRGIVGWIVREDTQDRWNHVVLSGHAGDLYEALPGHGYVRSQQSKYTVGLDLTWLTGETLTIGERLRRVDAANERLGLPYNWPAIAAIALHRLGLHLRWLNTWATNRRHVMCSEAIVEIAREAGRDYYPGRLSSTVTPGDIDFDFRLRGI